MSDTLFNMCVGKNEEIADLKKTVADLRSAMTQTATIAKRRKRRIKELEEALAVAHKKLAMKGD